MNFPPRLGSLSFHVPSMAHLFWDFNDNFSQIKGGQKTGRVMCGVELKPVVLVVINKEVLIVSCHLTNIRSGGRSLTSVHLTPVQVGKQLSIMCNSKSASVLFEPMSTGSPLHQLSLAVLQYARRCLKFKSYRNNPFIIISSSSGIR